MSRRAFLIGGIAVVALLVLGVGLLVSRIPSSTDPPVAVETGDPTLLGVFEGRVPCTDCERVKVRLTLFQDAATREPTTYVLELIHVGLGDERQTTEGPWTITHGTATDDEAIVYGLGGDATDGYRQFQVADENILLFRGGDGSLTVGDASHSFTLSRTG